MELEEFGREIEGRLETRIRHLTRLITEADRSIERLTAAVTAAEEKAGPAQGEREPLSQRGRVVALSREGLKPAEIAEAVGLPKGEVELLLGLSKQPAPGQAPPA